METGNNISDEEKNRQKKEKAFKIEIESFLRWIPFYGNALLIKKCNMLEKENLELKINYGRDSVGANMITPDMDTRMTEEAIITDFIDKVACDTVRLFRISNDKNIPRVVGGIGTDRHHKIFEIKDYPEKIEKITGRIIPWVVLEKKIFHLDLNDALSPHFYWLNVKENGDIASVDVDIKPTTLEKILANAARDKVWEKIELPILENVEDENGKIITRVIGVIVADNSETGLPITPAKIYIMSRAVQLASIQLKNARLYEENAKAAINDRLTGLYNRRGFDRYFKKEIIRATRYNHPLSFAIIDIDHFKQVNDTFSHLAGDVILKEMAILLSGAIRKDIDILSRYGGEEFALIIPETDAENAAKLLDNMRRIIENYDFSILQGRRKITISAGVADFKTSILSKHTLEAITANFEKNEPGLSPMEEEFIKCADSELYKAKNTGRNKVCVYSLENIPAK